MTRKKTARDDSSETPPAAPSPTAPAADVAPPDAEGAAGGPAPTDGAPAVHAPVVTIHVSGPITSREIGEALRRALASGGAPTLAPPRAAEPPPPPARELAELRAQESDAETLSALCAAQIQHPHDEVARAIGVLASRLARRVLSP